MLDGETIRLRLVREDDLPALQAFDEDIANRGDFYPLGVVPLPTLVGRYAQSGLWRPTEGTRSSTGAVASSPRRSAC